jgi:hypothetical protein
MTSNHDSAPLDEIAALQQEVEDVRASAIWWRDLYEAAVRRGVELEAQLTELKTHVER